MDTRLYEAAARGNVSALSEFMNERGSHLLSEVTPGGNTALHLAAYYNHLEIVRVLLQYLPSEHLGVQNLQGNTAIHEAAKAGWYEIVNLLLASNKDAGNIVNNAGETALFKACEGGHLDIVKKLLPYTSSEHDNRTSDGQTPLHSAIFKGHTGVIEILLEHRSELLRKVDHSGRTPLHSAACVAEKSQIATLLMQKDRGLCYKVDKNCQSALHFAVKEGNVDLAEEILNYCKDCIEIVDSDGRNVLHLAAENAVQIFGRISRRIKRLVELLLVSKGGLRLINNLDNKGRTALDIVIEKMDSDDRLFFGMRRLLEENGAQMTPNMVEKSSQRSSARETPMWKMQIISVNAVLIATVAFAAAFTLNFNQDSIFFVVLVICNALAFCSSITSTILLMYALYGNKEDSLLLQTSLNGLWIALVALVIEFGSAMFIIIHPKHPNVAAMVWFMAIIVPITIRVLIFRSKEYVFSQDKHYIWVFVIFVGVAFILGISIRVKLVSAITTTLGFLLFLVIVNSMKTSSSRKHFSRDDGFSGAVWDTLR
ncbi:hypothetical protein KI387_001250, partial [Taxus chinensis]